MSPNKPKLLIVDDEIDICYLLKEILKINYNVFLAHTIKDAKKILIEKDPKIYLLDINLPDGNGLDLAAYIKNQQSQNNTHHIVMISAHNSSNDKKIATDIGVDFFLDKPLNPNVVINTINQLT